MPATLFNANEHINETNSGYIRLHCSQFQTLFTDVPPFILISVFFCKSACYVMYIFAFTVTYDQYLFFILIFFFTALNFIQIFLQGRYPCIKQFCLFQDLPFLYLMHKLYFSTGSLHAQMYTHAHTHTKLNLQKKHPGQ